MTREFTKLNWSEDDLVGIFEILPEVDKYETEHIFDLTRSGIRLVLKLWQLEKVVQIILFQEGQEECLIDLCLFVRGDISLSGDVGQQGVKISDCIVAPSRFSYIDLGGIEAVEQLHNGQDVSISVDGKISIRLEDVGPT